MNLFEFQKEWNGIVDRTINRISELRRKGYWILEQQKITGKSQKKLSEIYDENDSLVQQGVMGDGE